MGVKENSETPGFIDSIASETVFPSEGMDVTIHQRFTSSAKIGDFMKLMG